MITINGEAVDPNLIDEAFMRIKSAAEALSEVSCCERDQEFRLLAEDEVIDSILLAQEAERRIPAPGKDEVRDAFEATLREWRQHGASWDLLEGQRDDLRQETIARLRMEHFADSVWQGLPELTEEELQAWHHYHPESFRRPARAKVLHLIRFPEGNDPAAEYRTLVGLRRQIHDGADFAEIARTHTRKHDGEIDLGWIEHERTLNLFEAMLFSLREKEISPVFYYEQALHLVWIEMLKPEHITPFNEVIEQVRELAISDQRRQALNQLAGQLRETATIERPELS